MTNEIQKAFAAVKASDELKASTRRYLADERQKRQRVTRRLLPGKALPALALLLCLLGVGGYTILSTPVSYISMDINPSIELSLNRLDRVVEATAYNSDGQRLLNTVSVHGQTYTQAIDTLVDSKAMQPYLTSENQLTFTVASANTSREQKLISGIEAAEAGNAYNRTCRGMNTDMNKVHQAHQHGLSFGKYATYLELQEYDTTVTVEDCQNMTMGEMNRYIGQCKAEQNHHGQNRQSGNNNNGSTDNSNNSNNSNGNGQGHHGYHGGR